jgi:hypothetical protein
VEKIAALQNELLGGDDDDDKDEEEKEKDYWNDDDDDDDDQGGDDGSSSASSRLDKLARMEAKRRQMAIMTFEDDQPYTLVNTLGK